MRFIGGIDPGLTGALAVLDFETAHLHLWDTPTVSVQVGDKIRKRCDPIAYAKAIGHFPLDYSAIENVASTPNDGHVGAFTFGKVTGIAIGIYAGMDLDLAQVHPAKWKMAMQTPAAKDAAMNRASELFPFCRAGWSRKMDNGRAEAAIIALYQAIQLELLPTQPFQLGLVNGKPFSAQPKKAPTRARTRNS
jgi:Holliday junction resolvasome RuvABC endonuclease subunit